MAPRLIELTKEMARDPNALNGLSMDQTSASYKMKYGLSAEMEGDTIWILRSIHFSLNMDESTSDNLKKVLFILVSFYSPVQQTSVIHYLASVSIMKAVITVMKSK